MMYYYYFLLFMLLLLTSCQDNTPNSSSMSSAQKTLPTTADTTQLIQKDSLHSIRLTFVGDIMGHDDQIRAAVDKKEHFKSKNMAHFNYEPCFRYVKPILEKADMAIGNLELTLSNKGRYTGYPMFRSPDALAYALKDAGFDFLTTCNNHSNDGRVYGVNHTIDVLDSLDILHTGTFKDTAAWQQNYPLIIEKKVDGTTFKLAFLSYTYSTNGVKTRAPNIINRIEDSTIVADIQKAKASQPDMIIAMMHWGREYKLDEYKTQQKLAQLLWENGVNVVIGGHPHVIEPIKLDTIYNQDSTQQRETLVTYSLGNFISNQTKKNTDIGLLFELELVKNSKTNQTYIGKHDYIFGWRYRHNYSVTNPYDAAYTVVPVSAFEQQTTPLLKMPAKDSVHMLAVTNRMRTHLGKWQSKERKVSLAELGDLLPIDSTITPPEPASYTSTAPTETQQKNQGVPINGKYEH